MKHDEITLVWVQKDDITIGIHLHIDTNALAWRPH